MPTAGFEIRDIDSFRATAAVPQSETDTTRDPGRAPQGANEHIVLRPFSEPVERTAIEETLNTEKSLATPPIRLVGKGGFRPVSC